MRKPSSLVTIITLIFITGGIKIWVFSTHTKEEMHELPGILSLGYNLLSLVLCVLIVLMLKVMDAKRYEEDFK